jgi:translation initiation factor IF-2
VVAINKCDKEGVNTDHVRFQLLDLAGINTEQLGGDVQCVEISARTGQHLDSLLEAILLQAEMLDLRSDPSSPAYGVCLESRCDRQIGNVASLVVKSGTLRVGDHIVHSSLSALSGDLHGRVRMMLDPGGHSVSEALAGTAVAVTGMKEGISPGAEFLSVIDEREAKALSQEMITLNSEAASTLDAIADTDRRAAHEDRRLQSESQSAQSDMALGSSTATTGEAFVNDALAGDDPMSFASSVPFINVIVKADVQGAADAVAQCVKRKETNECPIRVLQAGVGDVVESDVLLASAVSGLKGNRDECYIVAFNVRVRAKTAGQARGKLRVLSHSLIYKVEEEIEELVKTLTASRQRKERTIGAAGVVRVFEQGSVAGCLVQDGFVGIGVHCRVLRFPRGESSMTREVIHEAKITSLKQFSKDARSVAKGSECGVALQGWSSFEAGDVLECIEIAEGSLIAGRRGRYTAP